MKLSIAIPDSCLVDESTNLDKSRKISLIARTCAIFEIDAIFVYHENGTKEDLKLLLTILKYLETPQYLRRRVFAKINELKYAGILHPLKIPSHNVTSDSTKISASNIREPRGRPSCTTYGPRAGPGIHGHSRRSIRARIEPPSCPAVQRPAATGSPMIVGDRQTREIGRFERS